MQQINIAIDGFSSCGKSTLAKALAKKLHYTYIDSGAMYRATTFFALQNKLLTNGVLKEEELVHLLDDIHIELQYFPETNKLITLLNGENVEDFIRTPEVSNAVSEVSKIKAVRKHMVNLQQKMGEGKGVIMDGRDIGTVVFPQAELKLFLVADPTIRAERRFAEMQAKGVETSLENVFTSLEKRDYNDTHRAMDPLKKAPDAIEIDNSNLTETQQLNKAMGYYLDALETIVS